MVKLGDIVIDKITGFSGVATARLEKLYENVQILVEPTNIELQSQWIAENRLNTSGEMYGAFEIVITDEVKAGE